MENQPTSPTNKVPMEKIKKAYKDSDASGHGGSDRTDGPSARFQKMQMPKKVPKPEETQEIPNDVTMEPEEEESTEALSANDPNSYSNPEEVVVSHIDLELEVDFSKHTLKGSVHLTLTKLDDAADHVIIDCKDLTIHSICTRNTSEQLPYTVGKSRDFFGSKLTIQLPTTTEKKCEITINYETDPECSALQWLRPSQTVGKKLPYVFSQCQAVHCRSIIPCQDTPSVKAPYTAKITAPKDLKMLMSAKLISTSECEVDANKMCYNFEQPVPIPSYLFAIVGGDLVSRDIGPRSKVWSEPAYVDKAAYEFTATETMLKAAEELLGPYVWGHYDLLVLPPSFPYGGMENPCLTFVTPTLLAGDQSLADVVAHEIAHSWTGNLVTNKTMEHFWLNEGNTVFVETKIVSRLNGGKKYRDFIAGCSWRVLEETVRLLSEDYNQPEYTRLVPKMAGVDPDDAFSSVPYEKGHALLFYLESLLGGPEVFDPFLRAYVEKFKYKSITTDDWKEFLLSYFHEQVAAGMLDSVDWDAWLYGEGMPPVKPVYDGSLTLMCRELADRWLNCSDDDLEKFWSADIIEFRPQQTMTFLVMLLNEDPLSHAKIKAMGEKYNFNDVRNSEIRVRWLRLCIKAEYKPIIPAALEFVTDQGRMKFIKVIYKWLRLCIKAEYKPIIPAALEFVTDQGRMKFIEVIYKDLYEWDEAREAALQNFEANKDSMHNISVATVEKAMDL